MEERRSIKSVWIIRCAGATAICTAIVAALHLSTRSYAVYSNDFPILQQAAVILPVFALCLFIVTFGLRRLSTWVLVLVLITGLFFCRFSMIKIRLINCTSSCANHSGVWWKNNAYDATKALPNSTEFMDLLTAFWGDSLHPGGARCPGYRRAGTKTGVIFIGGGLYLDSLREEEVLIAFCSWRSHPPPYDHQHCLVWHWGEVNNKHQGIFDRECANTGDMIQRIGKALAQAESGKVPYSPDATLILKDELAQRKELAKRIKDAQPTNAPYSWPEANAKR